MTGAPFAADAHPTPDQLADFGRGAIDETRPTTIERHLADCTCAWESWKSRGL